MNNTKTIAITGAAGQIGYALVFAIASGRMLGPDTKINLKLIELPQALDALRGVVMELEDCAFPLLNSITATDNLAEGFSDIDWALLVGAAPRKAGMERSDLLKMNGQIFAEQGKFINQHAKPSAKVLVVGNPCNTNCLVTKSHAKQIPENNFFAMTMLDQHRAYAQIANAAHVSVAEINNLAIFGNHSATQFPDTENAFINNKSVSEIVSDQNWLQNDFISCVQQRGAQVIQARGMSSAASAANAAIDTVAHIEGVKNAGKVFSVGLCSKGEYGATPGLIVSYPTVYKNGSLHVIDDWEHSDFAKIKIKNSFDELYQEYEQVKKLGLLDETV